jgi:murein endopeptidase
MLLGLVTIAAFAAEFGPSLEGELLATEAAAVEDTAADTGAAGSCSSQYLQDGVLLPELPLFYVRVQPNASWGSQEMVDLLVDAGRHMSWLLPHASPFVVGDISHERGGYIAGHVSHRGGVDADVGIYKKGGWQHSRGFTNLAPSELDLEANWALISHMLASGKVDFILIDRGHIRRLREYVLSARLLSEEEADRIFPPEGSRGTWANTGIVRHAPNHQDHIHVRVLCSDGSRAGE